MGFAILALANVAIQPYGLKLSMVKDQIEDHEMRLARSLEFILPHQRRPSWEQAPSMWGPSPTMPATRIEQRYLVIDGSAWERDISLRRGFIDARIPQI